MAASRRVFVVCSCCLVVAACGYTPSRRVKPALVVSPVRNATAQAEAAGIFAAELRSELAGRGRLAPDGSGAPELSAELLAIRAAPSAMGAEGAAAWRLEADLHVRAPAFDQTATGAEDYLAGVDVLGTEANRRAALRRLARQLAREMVERLDVAERLAR